MNPFGNPFEQNNSNPNNIQDIYLDPSKIPGYKGPIPQKPINPQPQQFINTQPQPINLQPQQPQQPVFQQVQLVGGPQHIIISHDPNINSPQNTSGLDFL